jgi:hypothetical protein
MFRFALVFVLLQLLGVQTSAQAAPPDFGTDLQGRPIHRLAGPSDRFVVLIFAASDCPISNRYVPEVARLNREFAGKGVRFWWVFPNPDDTAQIVEQHKSDFALTEEIALDPHQSLVRRAEAKITPEAAVFAVAGGALQEVYHGRIDDRYISLGRERPQAGRHDLEEAIAAALAGKPVPPPGGPSVGCSIVFLQK